MKVMKLALVTKITTNQCLPLSHLLHFFKFFYLVSKFGGAGFFLSGNTVADELMNQTTPFVINVLMVTVLKAKPRLP